MWPLEHQNDASRAVDVAAEAQRGWAENRAACPVRDLAGSLAINGGPH